MKHLLLTFLILFSGLGQAEDSCTIDEKTKEMGLRVNILSGEKMQKFIVEERKYWLKMISNFL